jgi:hypothetical protein
VSYRGLAIPEGDEPFLVVPVATVDDAGVPAPLNLTGAVISMTVKASPDATDASGTTTPGRVEGPRPRGWWASRSSGR